MSESGGPIRTPPRQRLAEFRQRGVPAVVWVLAVVACWWLIANRAPRYEYLGLAQGWEYTISSESTGTVETVLVDQYDFVEAGTVVAKLDPEPLEASLETARATVRLLTAELEAARARLPADSEMEMAAWTADLRRFQIDEEQRGLDALAIQVVIQSDRIEQERLGLEVARAQSLVEADLVDQQEYDRIRLLHAQVGKRIEQNVILLEQTENELVASRERRRDFEEGLPVLPDDERLLAPLREAIVVETRRLEEIRLQREGLVMRSPVPGQVSAILCRQGQTVAAGEPILVIAERSVREIVAYVDGPESEQVDESSRVLIGSLSEPARVAESVVLRVGPNIEPLPQRLWRDPTMPSYGRAVVIRSVPALQLTPGAAVTVELLAPERSTARDDS